MSLPATKSPRIKSFFTNHASEIFDALFVFVVVFTLVLRFSTIDYPRNNEVYRDYLISHHIVEYGEHPATGPHNSVFASIRNSPFYFYYAAGILLVHDHIVALQAVNIVLQAFALLFLYLLGKRLFTPAVAWVAVVLYALSWVNGQQAFEFWQPYVMQPFALASLWLFARGWQDRRFLDLWLAVVTVTVGGIFHYSAFALLLMYSGALLYLLPKWKAGWKKYAILAFTVIGMIGAAYASVFWFAIHYPNLLSHRISGKSSFVTTPFSFAQNVWHNVRQLISVFFVSFTRYQWLRYVAGTLTLACVVYYAAFSSRTKRVLAWVLLSAMAVPVILAALFTSPPFDYYYLPIFGLFLLLVTAAIFFVFDKGRLLLTLRWLLVTGLIVVFSGDGYFAKASPDRAGHEWQRQAIVASIDQTITRVQNSDGYVQKNFFQFWVYQKGNPYRGQDAFFWDLLEKQWHQKLVHVVDYANGYLSDNTAQVQFFVCQDFGDLELDTCRAFFVDKNPGYEIVNEIYHQYPYVIYLTKYNPNGIIN